MKILLSVVLFSLSSMSQPTGPIKEIQALVLRDFNSLLSETYNEGEGHAEATQAKCQIVKYKGTQYIVYCSLEIAVRPDTSRRYKTSVTCTSIGYGIGTSLKYFERLSGWDDCIENINSTTEF